MLIARYRKAREKAGDSAAILVRDFGFGRKEEKNMKQCRHGRGLLALLLMMTMLVLVMAQGCAGGGTAGNEGTKGMTGGAAGGSGEDGEGKKAENQSSGGTGNTAMGRYVEEQRALPAADGMPRGLFAQKDGGLICYDAMYGLFYSEDQGQNWEDINGRYELPDAYIASLAVDGDGNLALICVDYAKEDDQEDDDFSMAYQGLLLDNEGNTVPVLLDGLNGAYADQLYFSPDGRLFLTAFGENGGELYEADRSSGKLSLLFTGTSLEACCFVGDVLVAAGNGQSFFYDLEAGQLLAPDSVLDDYLTSGLGSQGAVVTEGNSSICMTGSGTENTVYLAGSRGLYRHVLNGTVMEQIIDGNLSAFGNPSESVNSILQLADGNFLALFGSRLICYRYDETVAVAPSKELTIYSLKENATIRQAISQYQQINPDVYIRYEVGIDGSGSVTWDDAVKNLNTRIMSGTGPDVLVLDDLPVQSYEEKGMLLNLRDLLDAAGSEEELYENLARSMGSSDGIYAVPAKFAMPLLAGTEADIQPAADLAAFAAQMEKMRQGQPEGSLTGLYREAQMIRMLYYVSAASWMKEDGSVDRDRLVDFLTWTKRSWQAEAAGNTAAMEEAWQEIEEGNGGPLPWEVYSSMSGSSMDIFFRGNRLAVGVVQGIATDFSVMLSILDNVEEGGYRPLNGQSTNSFIPLTILGINSGTKEEETAGEFVQTVMSAAVQGIDLGDGLPVNRAAMEQLLVNTMPEGQSTMFTAVDENGNLINLMIRWPDEEEKAAFTSLTESLTTPCLMDHMIENTVEELGVRALNGSASVEDVTDEILRKIQLYLAE